MNFLMCEQIEDIELYVVMSFSALLWLQVGVVCGE